VHCVSQFLDLDLCFSSSGKVCLSHDWFSEVQFLILLFLSSVNFNFFVQSELAISLRRQAQVTKPHGEYLYELECVFTNSQWRTSLEYCLCIRRYLLVRCRNWRVSKLA
jgi:hypothetical protein